MWLRTLKLGVRNLLLHKLRSFLTMLGTILGVGSVIAMLAIGEGSKRKALDEIRLLGATNVILRSVKPEQQNTVESASGSSQNVSRILEYGLLYKDYDQLKATLPTVRRILPIALVRKDAQHASRRVSNARILGTTPSYLHVKHLKVRRGRFLTDTDLHNMRNVCVLGAGAAIRMFHYTDPMGQALLLGDDVYEVVGVLGEQGSGSATPGAIGQQDFNNDIYIPLPCVRARFGEMQVLRQQGSMQFERLELSEITLTVFDENYVSQTAAMARSIIERNHPDKMDYDVQVPLELLRQAEKEKRIWNLVLGSIAGISLLVGGIGIMNIMLATVTERTREIGIRRALGARRWDITSQFLVETMVLSTTGGVIGIIVGIALPLVVSYTTEIEAILSLWSVLLAFGISATIGVVFGMYPARRAAMMDPIEALRHE